MPECNVCGLVTTLSPCSVCGSETTVEKPNKSVFRKDIGSDEEKMLPFGLEGGSGQSAISSIPFGLDISPIMHEKRKLAFGLEESPRDHHQDEEITVNSEPLSEEISKPLPFDLSDSPNEDA